MKKIMRYLSNDDVNWHFMPPRSPHFGGLWETSVKSFKNHLYRTVGDASFTYEQFNTIIIEIESILNSRLLIPLSSDPNDLSPITPVHFLIGGTLTTVPEEDLQDTVINRLSSWQHVQKIKQHFWRRWSREYLHELHTRNKWHQPMSDKINIGTMVMLREDNLPPLQWCLGRVIELHPGEDNVVRVVTVKTATGNYKRSVKKLSPLPTDFK
jgi:Family of unknown function (DUF5641)